MFHKKPKLLIAITTFDSDALKISVPPLKKIGQRVTLVVHNDNPDINLRQSLVRRLGWRGKLHIINVSENLGELESKLNTIEFIAKMRRRPDWVMLADDDDVVLGAEIPKDIPKKVFAIIQNATTIRDNLVEVLKINRTWASGTKYGVTGPHFDIRGTWVRTDAPIEFAEFMRGQMPQIKKMAHMMKYRLPIGAIMWTGLNIFMRHKHIGTEPIYMNKTNYVVIRMGRATTKYNKKIAPGTTAASFMADAVARYTELFEMAATQSENMVAKTE